MSLRLDHPSACVPCRNRPEKGELTRNRTICRVLAASAVSVAPGARPRPKGRLHAKSRVMPDNSGNAGLGCWPRPMPAEEAKPATREIGSHARRRRSNRDRRHPLHFSQRLQALSAEWTPALYLAVPFPAPVAAIFGLADRVALERLAAISYDRPHQMARTMTTPKRRAISRAEAVPPDVLAPASLEWALRNTSGARASGNGRCEGRWAVWTPASDDAIRWNHALRQVTPTHRGSLASDRESRGSSPWWRNLTFT